MHRQTAEELRKLDLETKRHADQAKKFADEFVAKAAKALGKEERKFGEKLIGSEDAGSKADRISVILHAIRMVQNEGLTDKRIQRYLPEMLHYLERMSGTDPAGVTNTLKIVVE